MVLDTTTQNKLCLYINLPVIVMSAPINIHTMQGASVFEPRAPKDDYSPPSSVKRELFEHKMALEDIEVKNTYKCCFLGTTDKRVLTYITQVLFALVVLTFSIVQLHLNNSSCEATGTYLPLITSIIGYFLPAPTMH